jgi:HlyD family secretion protein
MSDLRARMLTIAGTQLEPHVASRDMRGSAWLGIGAIAGAFALFALWALAAPLSGAVIAMGSFVSGTQNRIVQHLEGGIVAEILVREGDVVEAGQLLVRLDETAARAMLHRHELRHALALAEIARLRAEQAGAHSVSFPPELFAMAEADTSVAEIIDAQRDEFEARNGRVENEIEMVAQRGSAIAEEISGLEAKRGSVDTQLDLIGQELAAMESLYEDGFTTLSRVLALRRAEAQLTGELGQVQADIARARERMTEIDRQMAHLEAEAREATAQELGAAEAALADAQGQAETARDVLDRLELRSPVRGIVVTLSENTTGGVVGSGENILEIVPLDDELVVEARVAPGDIDQVRIGGEARVRLSAFNQRTTPAIDGEVIYVSADTVGEGEPGGAHYVARIRLHMAAASGVNELVPSAGMPAEVFISTGARTFAEYLMRPVLDSFSRAFREG